jgi:hypothetical protein
VQNINTKKTAVFSKPKTEIAEELQFILRNFPIMLRRQAVMYLELSLKRDGFEIGTEHAANLLDMFVSQKLIYENCGLISCVKNAKYDDRLIEALWVMLEYVKEIPARQIFRPESPAQICFICDNNLHEIISFKSGDEWYIQKIKNKSKTKDEEKTKYIFVANCKSTLKYIINLPLKELNVTFALLTKQKNKTIVEYYDYK